MPETAPQKGVRAAGDGEPGAGCSRYGHYYMSNNTTVTLPPSCSLGCDRSRTCLLLPCQPYKELGPGPSNEMLKEICLAGLEEASASVVDLGLMHFMGSRGKENRKTWPGHCCLGRFLPGHLQSSLGRGCTTGHGVTSCTVSVFH